MNCDRRRGDNVNTGAASGPSEWSEFRLTYIFWDSKSAANIFGVIIFGQANSIHESQDLTWMSMDEHA